MLLEVQCEVSTVSDDLGCHVICLCWSTVFSEVHSQRSHLPGNFRALHASFSESESESESALFAKCVQTHKEFVVVFKKLLVHTCIHTYIHTYKHTYLT